MELIIGLAAVALIAVFFISQYNRLIRLNITVDEAWAQIEVQLKRRADLIPNLVETVKGYAKHEQSTFDAVVTARAKATTASTVADTAAADGMLTQALRGLLAVVAFARAVTTASKVDCSCLAYPLTVSTKLGIKSARRFSCTSICAHASSTVMFRRIRRLY